MAIITEIVLVVFLVRLTMGFRLSSTMLLMVVFPIILALERGELLDMSYEFGDTTPSWPGNELFQLTLGYRGPAKKYPW